MPRNEVEFCMFCSPGSCVCVQKPQRKTKSKIPPALTAISVLPFATPAPVSVEPKRTGLMDSDAAKAAITEEDEFKRAVTLLCTSGLVTADSVAENVQYLDMNPVQAKMLIWKLRHRERFGEVK